MTKKGINLLNASRRWQSRSEYNTPKVATQQLMNSVMVQSMFYDLIVILSTCL
jgi:hypothetical protein